MEENKQIQKADPSADIVDTDKAGDKLRAMFEFIKANLKKGTDYMSIGGGKPTLLKSGAEKMNILMKYNAEYEKIKEIMNPKDKFYYVEIKCTLRGKNGYKVAEALASCNNHEKNRKTVEFADALNTVLKMAEKRAYVAATLNANALSQFYTQDLEDTFEKKDDHGAIDACLNCGTEVTQKVAEYSKNYFSGKILCVKCQKIVKEAIK